jgi:hypothetical protein
MDRAMMQWRLGLGEFKKKFRANRRAVSARYVASQQLCESMVATSPSSVRNTTQSHEPTPECSGRNIALRAHKRSFTCDSQGCKSKTFSSRTDLYRHQQAHETNIWYSCAAEDCLRKGKKGFYREDKLIDHMIAAHDNDTLFACPDNHLSRHGLRRKCGGLLFTRDIMAIHALDGYQHRSLARLNEYRDCPLPKCPYRIYLGRQGASLDPLQAHLINKHDAKGRQNFTGRIRERGYDAATGEIICPLCPGETRLADHSSFYHHFFVAHFDGPVMSVDASDNIPACLKNRYGKAGWNGFAGCTSVSDGVRQCRRTILSLWPNFADYPVWEDVKACSSDLCSCWHPCSTLATVVLNRWLYQIGIHFLSFKYTTSSLFVTNAPSHIFRDQPCFPSSSDYYLAMSTVITV